MAIKAEGWPGNRGGGRPSPVILTVATANVLTLDAGRNANAATADTPSLPTGRMTILQQQAHAV
eukprot:11370910-Alexandrium_andersonii.AAC.1